MTSISVNADEPRDAALCKIDNIAPYTKYNSQAMSISWQKIATQTDKHQLLAHI